MENIKVIFDSLKEFIWDIVGYLIPGSYILIILSVCIESEYFFSPSFGSNTSDFSPYAYIIISYLLGYVAYGFGWFKEGVLSEKSYVKKIEANVGKRKAFVLSKELLSKALLAKGIIDDLNNATVRDVRSLAMSYIPEYDQKIYTFTFRSELSNQTANISLIIGTLGLLFSILKYIPIISNLTVFKTELSYVVLYVFLIICYFFLRYSRDRFYAISIGLPFSIYTVKAINS